MRKGGAIEESLWLAARAAGTLRELVREAPGTHALFTELSEAYHQISKARWLLSQAEETVDACQQAVEAQRQALTLAPALPEYRRLLGQRYMQLGRKLCELGRLDEAEACFGKRQALWPGDTARHAEALQELRKWAAKIGDNKKAPSQEEQEERQHYVALYARLQSKGLGRSAQQD